MSFAFAPYSSGAGSAMTDAQWGEFAKALLGTGVIKGALIGGSPGNDLAVTAPGSGMTVNLGTGQAMVYGHWCQNDASAAQTITAADPTNPRIDRVVLKHDVTAKTVSVVVKAGTPAPSPTAPSLTQTPSTWEMSLCQVAVGAGVSAINSGNVTDERTYAIATGAVAKTGDTMTGNLTVPALFSTNSVQVTGANQGLEVGAKASSNTPFIDLNSSGNSNDYDVRLVASGGTGASGNGTLNVAAGSLTRNGNKVMDTGNDGAGSTFDADMVDGLHASSLVQVGSGNQAATPVLFIIVGPTSAALPAAGTKGRIGIVATGVTLP
jgi:hypothetical protein